MRTNTRPCHVAQPFFPRTTTSHAPYNSPLSGIAAPYVLNECVLHWWDPRRPPDDETKPSSPSPPSSATDPATDVPAPVTDPEHVDPNRDARTPSTSSLPPLRTHALPPP
ncbi:hypothetical protein OG21DRAFT_1605173, partial [Imleria badia]